MSDFVSGFWHYYVAGLVILSLLFCVWILISNSTAKKAGPVELQEHVWDEDLQEYNNPLPGWWRGLFWGTIIFSVGYLILYPGLGTYQGVLKWSSTGQYQTEVDDGNKVIDPLFDKYSKMDTLAVAQDHDAKAMGQRMFLAYCSQCHGADARGNKGFPDLTDKVWLWGGTSDKVTETITGGRVNAMPAFGSMLSGDQIKDLANYVRSLSGKSNDSIRTARGKDLYANNPSVICWTCHGKDGKGDQNRGIPNLTDSSALYGRSEATIIETITNGRNNQMPSFKEMLGDKKIHVLAAYVLSLSQESKDNQ